VAAGFIQALTPPILHAFAAFGAMAAGILQVFTSAKRTRVCCSIGDGCWYYTGVNCRFGPGVFCIRRRQWVAEYSLLNDHCLSLSILSIVLGVNIVMIVTLGVRMVNNCVCL
jgi:hypothetical protein